MSLSVEGLLERHEYRVLETVPERGSFDFACRVESTKHDGLYFIVKGVQVRGEADREAAELQDLSRSHPNHIVPICEFFLDGDVLCLVFEFFPGVSLADRVRKAGPLSGDALYSCTAQILDALICCHERKIAHQHLTPESFLIDEQGRARLADFRWDGMSCCANGSDAGSRRYWAPEVLARQKRDARLADVWSLGVILFVISTGHLPWPADNDLEFEKAVRLAKLDFPSFVHPKFAAVVQSMVRVTPWKRMKLKEALDIVTNLGSPTLSS